MPLIDLGQITGRLTDIETITGVLADAESIQASLTDSDQLHCSLTVDTSLDTLVTDEDIPLATSTGDDLVGVGFVDAINITGHLSVVAGLSAKITIPSAVIPSNYGLITWNGSTLMVS